MVQKMKKTNHKNAALLVAVLIILLTTLPIQAASVSSDWTFGKRNVESVLAADIDLTKTLDMNLSMVFSGVMETKKITTDLNSLSLSYSPKDTFRFSLGKQGHFFGRARINNLFFGQVSPEFLSARYDLTYDKIAYTRLYGDLADKEDFKKLGAHYLSIDVNKYVSVGIGEAFIAIEPFKGDMVYTVTPLLPYYLAKYMPGITSRIDSSLVYLDGQVNLDRAQIYGEFVVSEFPMVPKAQGPALYGFTVGTDLDLGKYNLLVEHTRVMNYTYTNSPLSTSFVYGDKPLAHELGQDFKKYDIQIRSEEMLLSKVGLYHQVVGEGRNIDTWYKNVNERTEKKFLSGITETTTGVIIGLRKDVMDNVSVNVEGNVGYVKNLRNVKDQNDFVYQSSLSIRWEL